MTAVNLTNDKLRAWWAHRQGLDGRLAGEAAGAVLAQTGWARSVAGVGPYLTLFSRAGIGREQADEAMRKLEIHELPAARGCTYVVPSIDFALSLKLAQPFDHAETKVAERLGVKAAEIDKLCGAVVSALADGDLDPSEIRDRVGPAARSLGEEGKKKGLSTTLPVALGRLQTEGEIRRVPVNGRLDQQRYRYALWRPNPLARFKLTAEECAVELARRYFQWIGPATVAEFQWFSGLGIKAAKAAVEPLNLVAVGVDDRLLLAELREAWDSFRVPKKPQYALVSSLDGINQLRRDVKLLVADEDLKLKVPVEKGMAALETLPHFPSHAILDRGRLIGLWVYDPDKASIVWMTWVPKDAALKKTVAATEAYIRDQVGDARSFSLDSPQSRAPRIAALRVAAG